jgi:Chlamydia-phage Chp2 scaffold (Chlamy_scaf).
MAKYPVTLDQYSRPVDPGLDCSGSPSMAKQEFKDDCNLNNIVRKYVQTGQLPESIIGTYDDFSDAPDFFAAQLVLARADAQFSAMPAEVRSRFDNDPGEFLEFLSDRANFAEARKMGLLSKESQDAADVAAAAAVASVVPAKVS